MRGLKEQETHLSHGIDSSLLANGAYVGHSWGFPAVGVKEVLAAPKWVTVEDGPAADWLKKGENATISSDELGKGTKQPLPQGSPEFIRTGRAIIRTVKLILRCPKSEHDVIASRVWHIGTSQGLAAHPHISPEEKARWRGAVSEEFGLARGVKPASSSAADSADDE
jgi:hypothetical protein